MPVQTAETCRGKRLVDRRVEFYPGIAAGYSFGMSRQQRRKCRIEQAGIPGAASMMNQADNRIDAELPQCMKPFIVPAQVFLRRIVRRYGFLEYRISQGPYSQRRDFSQIRQPVEVPRFVNLISNLIADSSDRAFETAPNFKLRRFFFFLY